MSVLVAIIGYGGVRVSSGELTAGDMVAFILYLIQIIMPMTQLTMFFTQLQKAMGATERISALLEYEEEHIEEGLTVEKVDQPIYVKNVDFSYGEEPILSDINFTIEPGKVTAIVGPSGGGKTTTFSLLERYYRPTNGSITLGDTPIETFSPTLGAVKSAMWRRKVPCYQEQFEKIFAMVLTVKYKMMS